MDEWDSTNSTTGATNSLIIQSNGGIGGLTYYGVSTVGGNYGVGYKQPLSHGNRVSPRLYFKYVKSKLKRFTKEEKAKIEERMDKLKKLLAVAMENEQQALYETVSKELVHIVKQTEAVAAGYDLFVSKDTIEKFRSIVDDAERDDMHRRDTSEMRSGVPVVNFKELSEFPRLIPIEVKAKLKSLKKKAIFDEYWILYLDYKFFDKSGKPQDEVKSTKEKIREKDPIVFGRFATSPDEFYFIADWVDEHCDLTFDRFVDTVAEKDLGYQPSMVPDIDSEFIEKLKQEVLDREKRLKETGMNNWRQQHADQSAKAVKAPKPSFWAWLKSWFK